MATETAQYETQCVENAEEELEKAKQVYETQMGKYQAAGEEYCDKLSEYRNRRRFWLD